MRLFNYILAACAGIGLGNTKADVAVLTLLIYGMLTLGNKIGEKYWGKHD